MTPYDPSSSPWQIQPDDFPADRPLDEQIRFLLGYAALAPSSHNTEPWKFAVQADRVRVLVDESRWLKVADADKRELHVSIGCAIENLLVAAERFGLADQVHYFPEPDNSELAAVVEFEPHGEPSGVRPPELFEAIKTRQTNHQPYDKRDASADERGALQACVVEEGVELRLIDEPSKREHLEELMVQTDAIQFADPEWRKELGHWIGKGAFGNSWLMAKMGKLAVTYLDLGKSTAKSDARAFESAPLFAFIVTSANDRTTQVRSGQVLERIWLKANSMGLAMQPMNQVLQVDDIKEEVVSSLQLGASHPQIGFRLGHAEREDKRSPRRPVAEMLVRE